MDVFAILCSIFFSLIGMGMLSYAKKNASFILFGCGLGLMVYPYFVSNDILLVVIGLGLCGIAWFFKD